MLAIYHASSHIFEHNERHDNIVIMMTMTTSSRIEKKRKIMYIFLI